MPPYAASTVLDIAHPQYIITEIQNASQLAILRRIIKYNTESVRPTTIGHLIILQGFAKSVQKLFMKEVYRPKTVPSPLCRGYM